MKKTKLTCSLILFLLVISISDAQVNCEEIQCDCENIAELESDPGLKELCKYYEDSAKELCKKGEKGFKCHETAKGPNAWTLEKSIAKAKEELIKKKNMLPFMVDVPEGKSLNELKYCNQVMSFLKNKSIQFANIKFANEYGLSYFKEAWAYDYNDVIYVITASSKKKTKGYEYEIDMNNSNFDDYEYHVYSNVKKTNWKKFSASCKGCNYDERFVDFIKKSECDCL